MAGALVNFILFIAFAIGILGGHYLPYFKLYLIAGVITFVSIYVYYRKRDELISDIFIPLLFIFLGGCWYIAFEKGKTLLSDHQYNIVFIVTSIPQEYRYKNTFTADVYRINNLIFPLRIRVNDYTKRLCYRNKYEVRGTLRTITWKKSVYILWIPSTANIKVLPLSLGDKYIKRISYKLLSILKETLDNRTFRVLASVFLGRRELAKKEEMIFANAGVSHLIAISGQNIALIAFDLFFILKLFGIKFRARLLLSLLFLASYSIITGLSASTLRSLIMYTIISASFFVKRKVCTLNSLGIAGYITLLINPSFLFDIGFQLSFLCVFALITGFSLFTLQYSSPLPLLLSYSKNIIIGSLLTLLFTTPLISYYFGRIYILSILYNVILIPLFSVLLAITLLLILFSPWPFIANSLGSILSLFTSWFLTITQWLGKTPFTFIYYSFSLCEVIIYYVILLLIGIALYQAWNKKHTVQ